jgi:predicted transcriptional regulator
MPHHSDALRKIMLRRFMVEYQVRTGQTLTQNKLAQLLGIKQAQISQYLSSERKITERRWLDVVRILGAEDTATSEDYAELQKQLASKKDHHGQLLREHLKNRGISHKQSAQLLKVSAAAVTNFLYSEQFRPELLQKLKEEVGFTLPAAHNQRNAVFLHSNQKVADLENQPLFDLSQIGIELDLSRTIVVQTDAKTKVVAVRIEKEDYENTKGLVVMHCGNRLTLCEASENDLLKNDIRDVYKIVLSITLYS